MLRLSLRSRWRGSGGRWFGWTWLIDGQSEIPAFPAIAIGRPAESEDHFLTRLHRSRRQVEDVQPGAGILRRLFKCGRPPIHAEAHNRPRGQLQSNAPPGWEEINLMIEPP